MFIQPNSRVGTKPPAPAYNDAEDRPYRYSLYFSDFSRIGYSDNPTELMELIIEGYGQMNDSERLDARLQYALGAQRDFQRLIERSQAKDEVPEWQWRVATGKYNEDSSSHIRGFGHEQEKEMGSSLDLWAPAKPLPLALVDAYYQPYSQSERPFTVDQESAPVFIIRAMGSDEEFLRSLNPFGKIALTDNVSERSVS